LGNAIECDRHAGLREGDPIRIDLQFTQHRAA
jgi:hypothetical protein